MFKGQNMLCTEKRHSFSKLSLFFLNINLFMDFYCLRVPVISYAEYQRACAIQKKMIICLNGNAQAWFIFKV